MNWLKLSFVCEELKAWSWRKFSLQLGFMLVRVGGWHAHVPIFDVMAYLVIHVIYTDATVYTRIWLRQWPFYFIIVHSVIVFVSYVILRHWWWCNANTTTCVLVDTVLGFSSNAAQQTFVNARVYTKMERIKCMRKVFALVVSLVWRIVTHFFYFTNFWQNAHINHFSLSIFIYRVRMCERVHCHSGLSTLFGPWATMSVLRHRRRRRWRRRRRQKPPKHQQQTYQWPQRPGIIIIIIYSDKKIHCIRNGKVFRLQCDSMTTRVDQLGMRMSTHNFAATTNFTENSNLI